MNPWEDEKLLAESEARTKRKKGLAKPRSDGRSKQTARAHGTAEARKSGAVTARVRGKAVPREVK